MLRNAAIQLHRCLGNLPQLSIFLWDAFMKMVTYSTTAQQQADWRHCINTKLLSRGNQVQFSISISSLLKLATHLLYEVRTGRFCYSNWGRKSERKAIQFSDSTQDFQDCLISHVAVFMEKIAYLWHQVKHRRLSNFETSLMMSYTSAN